MDIRVALRSVCHGRSRVTRPRSRSGTAAGGGRGEKRCGGGGGDGEKGGSEGRCRKVRENGKEIYIGKERACGGRGGKRKSGRKMKTKRKER